MWSSPGTDMWTTVLHWNRNVLSDGSVKFHRTEKEVMDFWLESKVLQNFQTDSIDAEA